MFKKYLTLWLVLFVGIISAYAGNCGVKDSVGVQKATDGTMIILHKVGAGETLYALERKYKKHGTTASKIKAANNGASTFNVGQTVNIPTTKKYGATSTSSPKVNHATTSSTSDKIHVVKAGETMFAITHKYNVSVADVKKWNHLSDNSVNVGQKLIVGKGSGTSTPTTNHATTTTSSSKNTHKVVAGETLYSIAHDNDMDVAELKALNPGIDKGINVGQLVNVKKGGGSTSASKSHAEVHEKIETTDSQNKKIYTGYEKVVEEGTTSLTNRKDFDDNFSYVFHKSIPYGVIVTVTNPKTGEYTYARVIGKLPENSPHIIEVSKTVWGTLKLSGSAAAVKIGYVL